MGRASNMVPVTSVLQKVYNLVIVLTGHEKRMFLNFKERLSTKGDQEPTATEYLELYKYLLAFQKSKKLPNTLSRYLQSKFGNERRAKITELADYLYKRILESLRRTESNDLSRFSKANGLLQDIHFLYGRNLYNECLDHIKKAETIVELLHNYPMLLELNSWKWKVYTALQLITDDYHEIFVQIAARNAQLLRWMSQANMYCATSKKLFFLIARKKSLTSDMESEMKQQLFDALPDPAKSESPLVQYWYYLARIYWLILKKSSIPSAEIKNREETFLEYYDAVLRQFEGKNRLRKDEESMLYMLVVDNYLNFCIRNNLKDRYEKIQQSISQSEDTLSYLRSVLFTKISEALGQFEFDIAHDLILKEDYLPKVENIRAKIPETRLVAIWFTCGQVYFILSDFEMAQSLFKKITEEVSPQVRPDLAISSQLFQSIVYFETKSGGNRHFEILENLRKSLKKRNQDEAVYKKILSLLNYAFKNIPRNKLKKMEPTEVMNLTAKISQLRDDFKANGNRIDAKLIFAWMAARINNTSIREELEKERPQNTSL